MKSNLEIPSKDASINEWQEYFEERCRIEKWDQKASTETFLLFTEEVGELAKAIRYRERIAVESGKQLPEDELKSELADVASYLLELASKYDIKLGEALAYKEHKNMTRKWD